MPSVSYLNQSAPFWDFISSLENQFGQAQQDTSSGDKAPAEDESEPRTENHHHHGSKNSPDCHRHPCSGRQSGRGFGGRHWAPQARMNPMASFFCDHPLGQFLRQFQPQAGPGGTDESKDFQPLVDVFTTTSAYHVHISLPGAKKEDVGVSYDAEKSELSVAGVVYRPGDEELLKHLDLAERKVGAFERKVKLGNERYPAEVDAESITAKLEDGILRVEIPRVEKDYVDVKKVDIN